MPQANLKVRLYVRGRLIILFHPIEPDDHLGGIALPHAHEQRPGHPLQFGRRGLELRLRAEIHELWIDDLSREQAAVYAGVPAANAAFRWMKEAMSKEQA